MAWWFLEEFQRVEAEPFSDALDRPQRQVALATFHATEVGAVHADLIGERFL